MDIHHVVARSLFAATISLIAVNIPQMQAAVYPMPPKGNDIVGEITVIRPAYNDTLFTVGNRYGVGMHEMLEANPDLGVDESNADQPLRGRRVVVKTQYILPPTRKGIVINMPELRLYYFTPDKKWVYTYPVGLGRDEWRTPLFQSKVVSKEVDPTWRPPASIRHHVLEETGNLLPTEVPPGPENPLGPYALRLSAKGYLIHGTNQPFSIGKYISSGCIRLHNEDVEELFNIVPVGTPVEIINHPYKAGWQEGRLYLQAQIPMQLNVGSSQLNQGSVRAVIAQALKSHPARVDWSQVGEVMEKHTGIPQLIGNYGIMSASLDREGY